MTWGNPPKFVPTKPKQGKVVTPEQLAGDSEHSQQVALFAWAAMNVDKYPALAYMFAIPNGGLRDVRTATSLKAEGVKAGVPDIFLPYGSYCEDMDGYFYGCFLELKWGKNRPTQDQCEYIDALRKAGYYCKVCYSWEEARNTLIDYLEGKI